MSRLTCVALARNNLSLAPAASSHYVSNIGGVKSRIAA
jgi:hypothetical protein